MPLQLSATEEMVEWEEKGKEWWSTSSCPHSMAKDRASERSNTQGNTNA